MKKLLILTILSMLTLSACGKKETETTVEVNPDIFTEIESRTYEFEESEGNNSTNVGDIYGSIDLSDRKRPEDSIGERYYYSENESFLGIGNVQENVVSDETTDSETESYESEYTDEIQTFEFDNPDVVGGEIDNSKESLENEITELTWKLKDGVDDFNSDSDLDTAKNMFSFDILEYTANVDYDFKLSRVATSSNGIMMVYDAPNDVQLVLVQATPDSWQKINYSVDQLSRLYINDTNIEYANFSSSSLYARWVTDDAVYVALAVNCGETGFSNILCDLV